MSDRQVALLAAVAMVLRFGGNTLDIADEFFDWLQFDKHDVRPTASADQGDQ